MYLAFPIFGFLMVAALVLVLRWSQSKGSLVRRVDHSPAAADSFGVLSKVRTVRTREAGRQLIDRLSTTGIPATLGRTREGWTIYVWPQDQSRALQLLDPHRRTAREN